MRLGVSYLAGLIFGIGIMVSGMANPAKVLNFFDVAGSWDPSLAFVMGGALAVTALGYRFVLRWPGPLLAGSFQLPAKPDLDLPLIGGSALFGIGWGIAGFCPGGALPALGTGRTDVWVFMTALVAGIIAARTLRAVLGTNQGANAWKQEGNKNDLPGRHVDHSRCIGSFRRSDQHHYLYRQRPRK